jgi:gamma-glutamylputrescine oxidase
VIVQNWWFTTLLEKKYKTCLPLQNNIECDVLIIGGGMSGVSAAAAFIGKGLKVVLVEKNILGGSSSGKSAGFLTPDSELELSQLVRRYGVKGANEIWQIPIQGIQLIKRYVEQYQIQCDFRKQDSLFLGIGNSGWQDVKDEIDCRKKVGFNNQSLYDNNNLQTILTSTGFSGATQYDETYGINTLQYLQGIKNSLLNNGIKIYESTEVKSINGNIAKTHGGSIKANQIVVAIDKITNSFSPLAKEIFHAQTFLSVSEPLTNKEVDTLFPTQKEFQMWDSTLVYSYWRLIEGNRILLGGGNAITTFLPNAWYHQNVIKGVHKRFKQHFPFLQNLNFIQYWPGLIDTTRDLLPTLTKGPSNKSIHYIMGVVGLPWASFCGDFVARNILNTATADEAKYYEYLSDRRYFAFAANMGKIIGKPALFALSNGWAKYYQKDTNHRFKHRKGEF